MSDDFLSEVQPFNDIDLRHLYNLLMERKPWQSISHKRMPSFEEHKAFVQSNPYKVWYLILDGGNIAGSIYLTRQNELGIFVYESSQGKGLATQAIKEVMSRHEGPFLANINPLNTASLELFTKLGFNKIQVTYCHE